jgi:glycosyltransferase involved in cell wall biosynthesis
VAAAPRVSVVLPVRDAAGTVARAVAGIRAQTLADWELIAVDDGSIDGTWEILESERRVDERIRVIPRPRTGIVAALNAGLAAARGGFVARMDADDEAHPERLVEQAAFLGSAENQGIGVAGCLVEHGGDPAATAGYALHVDWLNALTTPEEIALNRFVESPLAHPSVMFRRELVNRHGGYREGPFPEDYELWLRWLDAGVRMAKVARVLLRWNDPPGRASRTDPRYSPEAFYSVKAPWIARWLNARGIGAAGRRRVLVWGAGRPTRKRADLLAAHGVRIQGYVDIDARKATAAIGGTGLPVILPDELPPPEECFVLGYVSSRGARELIRSALVGRGHAEGRDFLMCA